MLENPALMPFLPAVCERLLGEQLRLPSVPTWWCGDPDGLAAVLDRARRRTRRRSSCADRRPRPIWPASPRAAASRILAAPHRFVGQERLPLSQAPAWGDAGRARAARPAPLVLRAFTVRYGAVYRPLVGGLATLVDDREAAPSTKDVWVLKAAPGDPDQGCVEVAPLPIARAVPVLSPRALEDMFWSGRYAERAEDLLRLVLAASAYAEQLDDSSGTPGGAALGVLIGVLHRLGGRGGATPIPSCARCCSTPTAPARPRTRSRGCATRWRACATSSRATRGACSAAPTGRAGRCADRARPQIAESAGRMLAGILSLQGVTANMIRDAGWHTIEAGRYLERSLQVCTLLAATTTVSLGVGVDRDVLDGVLMAAESSVTHRRRYRGNVRVADVLELLLLDADNPRSVAFSLDQLRCHLAKLAASTGSTRPERLLEHLETRSSRSTSPRCRPASTGAARASRTSSPTRTRSCTALGDAIVHLHFEAGPRRSRCRRCRSPR